MIDEIKGIAHRFVYSEIQHRGCVSVSQLQIYCGISHSHIFRILNYLIEHRFIKQIYRGFYSIYDEQSLFSGTQSPFGGTQSPSSGTQSPSSRTQSPFGGTQSPSSGTQSPSSGTQSPSSRTQSPSSRTQSPFGGIQNPSSRTIFNAKSKKRALSKVKYKKESKVKKEKLEKEKKPTTEGLLNLIPSVKMSKFVSTVGKCWSKFRESGFSPDLLHRIAFAVMEFDVTESQLNEILTEADKALKATDKTRISKRWVLISKRIQTVYETEGYQWTQCRPQNTAWSAEKKAARQEKREPRFELFPMERDKLEQHRKSQSEKQQPELTEQERIEAEEARRKFFETNKFKTPKPQIEPTTVPIDLSPISPPTTPNKKNVKPAVQILPLEPKAKQNKAQKTAAARVLTEQEAKKVREFAEIVEKKNKNEKDDEENKKIAQILDRKRKKKQKEAEKKLKEAENIVQKELDNAHLVSREIPDTEDNACFRYPDKVRKVR